MPTGNEVVEQQFGNAADRYAASTVHRQGADLDAIAAFLATQKEPRVLDAGAGPGHVTLRTARHSRSVTAFDLSDAMLEQVRRAAWDAGLTNVCTARGDAAAMPFVDGQFDVVITRYSAHHWWQPRAALRECARVLRPGGTLLVSDVVGHEHPALDTFLQTIELIRDPSHVCNYTEGAWRQMFSSAGFQAEVALRWPVRLDFNEWIYRLATPRESVVVLRGLLAGAADEIRSAFAVDAESHDFTIEGALFKATKRQ